MIEYIIGFIFGCLTGSVVTFGGYYCYDLWHGHTVSVQKLSALEAAREAEERVMTAKLSKCVNGMPRRVYDLLRKQHDSVQPGDEDEESVDHV